MTYDYKGMAGNLDNSFIINHNAPLFCYKNFQVQTGNRVENFFYTVGHTFVKIECNNDNVKFDTVSMDITKTFDEYFSTISHILPISYIDMSVG